ncbi:MAG: NADH-quinone oxidoreductase subunit L [Burkholderiaceae bacterium]
MKSILVLVPFVPLFGAVISGFLGSRLSEKTVHCLTIFCVFISACLSAYVFYDVMQNNTYEYSLYTWANLGELRFEIGFLVDTLSASMMLVVNFVSLMVHVYTIGYMNGDPGYKRFFSYISLFTFAMLMLVMSNNFLQLFFGWEAVGLVSYLLIGFWFKKETAIYANLKAFLVNRVGDLGFLLGIGLLVSVTGSLNYLEVFDSIAKIDYQKYILFEWWSVSLLTLISICLFIGAMGKSAQFPLHVWLPDSMEGPTPISALIHAATMVTAGIFMVSRMSPIFELSEQALIFIMIIGSITAFFMGVLGMIQNDIKKVVAYSTLSQLGYMTVALGASAYSLAMFHLITHAFFKALLFLAAGSVIIGMHHEQDIRKMGGLWKKMPITWLVSLIGSLSLIGFPFFSGFYSKDLIIMAVGVSNLDVARFVHLLLEVGVFITAFYSFRMFFMVFHGKHRFDADKHSPNESKLVVTLPLVLLAIPSLFLGGLIFEPLVFSGLFDDAIYVLESRDFLSNLNFISSDILQFTSHGFFTPTFLLLLLGVLSAFIVTLVYPRTTEFLSSKFPKFHLILKEKYFLDKFNDWFFASGSRFLGEKLFKFSDKAFIDNILVNGTAKLVHNIGSIMRLLQTGYLYHYAIAMFLAIAIFLWWYVPQPI